MFAALLATWSATPASAWILTINPGSRAVYLQVGNGTSSGNNSTINVVSVSVPANAVGSGAAQQMTSDSTAANSFYDGYNVCNPPAQVYVGGYFRQPSTTTTSAVLQVTSPASLQNGTSVIPFTQISWTSTANGNPAADIPAGTFSGGTQVLTSIASNTWVENCHQFSYLNNAVVAAGTYTGRVTYTLTAP
ncbi:MAG: hypothetical protein KGQ77_03165 [Betaproteobacteria bacterium]|nr:hypothetical protein [Betaproteobacteria bacterium]